MGYFSGSVLGYFSKSADITADTIKEGAALVDVGVSRVAGKRSVTCIPTCGTKQAGFLPTRAEWGR